MSKFHLPKPSIDEKRYRIEYQMSESKDAVMYITISSKKEEGKGENDQTCLNVISFERPPQCPINLYYAKVRLIKQQLDNLFTIDSADNSNNRKPPPDFGGNKGKGGKHKLSKGKG